jgi:membrane-anchored glycerophosphoryl diester phosphodiesterase (GDPDase)
MSETSNMKEGSMSTKLNPRNIGDILGDTFRIYGGNFWDLVAITAIVLGVLGIIEIIAGLGSLPLVITGGEIEALAGWVIAGLIILVVAYIVCGILVVGALIHAVSEQYLRQRISIRQAYGFAWKRLGAMLGAGILASLAIGGIVAVSVSVAALSWVGWILLVVGSCASIYLMIRWIFVLPAALLEGLGPTAALSRSSALVKKNWWRVLGITLVVALISAAISLILGMIPTVGAILASILVTPIYMIASTLLYYDLRVRKEGYSLEALASELHIEVDSDVT